MLVGAEQQRPAVASQEGIDGGLTKLQNNALIITPANVRPEPMAVAAGNSCGPSIVSTTSPEDGGRGAVRRRIIPQKLSLEAPHHSCARRV